MDIIFLDVDGVLNNWTDMDNIYDETKDLSIYRTSKGLSPNSIKTVKDIASEHNAKIVLSSTWRLHESNLQELEEIFEIHDVTPSLKKRFSEVIPRWKEILTWIIDNLNEIDHFIILDDDPWAAEGIMKEHFLKTNDEFGLYGCDKPQMRKIMQKSIDKEQLKMLKSKL